MNRLTFRQILIVITYTVLLLSLLFNIGVVIGIFSKIVATVRPLLIGLILALSMDCLVCLFERKLFTKPSPATARVISIVLSVCIVLGVFTGILVFSLPDIFRSVIRIIDNVPSYIETIKMYIVRIENWLDVDLIDQAGKSSGLESIGDTLTKSMQSLAGTLYSFAGEAIQFIISFVFSIYVLLDKKKIKHFLKRVFELFFSKRTATKIYDNIALCAVTFKSFISGQMMEALILGSLCFIGMVVIGLPYASLISILIGVTSIIPVLGTYIGAIPSALFLLLENPVQAFVFIVFLLALQQFENAVIYPKVVGDAVGIDGMLVFVGVTLGGGLGGAVGLLIGVPMVAVLFLVIMRAIKNKESKLRIEDNKEIIEPSRE